MEGRSVLENKELLTFLNKRLLHLKKRRLIHIIFAVRNKNEGKIEEIENIIKRLETDNFENHDYD
ncbi:hypothetical protein ASG89_33505 [Paenibacillus sp. Soil766]|uniref:hypothetical protein n=1 Tax=Paenibacillus sp. Soil766 TaxID=1736404 RepID=UPI00070E00B5|nr:hypothetical protein [Paenibacillus sp. Soil766]KRE92169.1 hypothetical protein ASG89_33505 [Paenibacillus sp. Soil766]